MYQKPDFVKVSLKVSDVFANYSQTKCPMDEGSLSMLAGNNCTDIYIENTTFVEQGWGVGCYHSQNP